MSAARDRAEQLFRGREDIRVGRQLFTGKIGFAIAPCHNQYAAMASAELKHSASARSCCNEGTEVCPRCCREIGGERLPPQNSSQSSSSATTGGAGLAGSGSDLALAAGCATTGADFGFCAGLGEALGAAVAVG